MRRFTRRLAAAAQTIGGGGLAVAVLIGACWAARAVLAPAAQAQGEYDTARVLREMPAVKPEADRLYWEIHGATPDTPGNPTDRPLATRPQADTP